MSLLIAIAVGLLALLFVTLPMLYGHEAAADPAPEVESKGDRLRARRDVIYDSIHDLEFDLAMGKLTAEDFAEIRGGLMDEAGRTLAELDATGPDDGLDGWIAAQVASRRTAGSCAKCGRSNPTGARFCDGCGTALARRCAECAAPLRDGAQFCGGCGVAQ